MVHLMGRVWLANRPAVISSGGSALAAFRFWAMPTRIECPLYPSPRDAILVAALTLRLIQLADSPKTLTLGAITAISCRIISRAFTPLGPDI